ncbi:MAG: hypothetical protein EXR58_00605 [Chloroflexi bacterium]|nr:hypothetical protein [Chloroflexota bacterium]
MRVIDLLRELQDVDTNLELGRANLARLGLEIGDRSSLESPAHALAEAREHLHQIESVEKDLELQAEGGRAKIGADEKRLYGGTIKNPKELGSLSDEVAQDRRQLDTIETRLLELLDQHEATAKQLADLETALARITESWNERQAQAQQRANELEKSVQDLESRRGSVAPTIDGRALSAYDTLRRQKGGIAIAQVLKRTCQSCRVTLTPALEQRARIGAELVPCHSCGRLLYVTIS